jgi:hypothetical protein
VSKETTSADETGVYILLGGVCNKVSCDVTAAATDSVGRGPKRTEEDRKNREYNRRSR